MTGPPPLRRCAAPCCRRAAAAHSRLCAGCRDVLAGQLLLLSHVPQAVAMRTVLRGVLASWAHVVVAGRVVARPVSGLVDFPHRHGDWLGVHPAAAEFTVEVADLVPVGRELVA